MKIKNLIELLKQYPEDTEATAYDVDVGGENSITGVTYYAHAGTINLETDE